MKDYVLVLAHQLSIMVQSFIWQLFSLWDEHLLTLFERRRLQVVQMPRRRIDKQIPSEKSLAAEVSDNLPQLHIS